MQVTAIVKNSATRHEVLVRTGNVDRALSVPPKSSGKGSAINGDEFLMRALATCYCNDL
jgi:organic hydroperoxide reductase OsmC/OhrA